MRDVAEAAKAGIDRTAGYVEGAAERAADYVKDAREALVDLRGRSAERVWTDIVRLTKKNPERALILAALAGLAVGLLCRRSQS